MTPIIFRCWVLVMAIAPLWAQQVRFRLLSNDDGLPQGVGRALFQDSTGYMWIGTYAGLARYNGFSFDNYGIKQGLANDFINCIREDRNGKIWVSTNLGLSYLNEGRFTNLSPDGQGRPITCFLFENERIWCATAEGLLLYQKDSFAKQGPELGLPSETINDILLDREHRLWVATHSGLFCRKGKVFVRVESAGNGVISALALSVDGKRLWAAREHDVIQLNGTTVIAKFGAAEGLIGLPATSLCVGSDDTLWMDVIDGVAFLEDNEATLIGTEAGLPVRAVDCILEDREGLIWIGGTLGVAIFTGRAFTNYGIQQGLASNAVRSLVMDQRGHLWVGTLDGLERFDRERWYHYRQADGLPDNFVVTLREVTPGTIAVCTRTGVCLIENDKAKIVPGLPQVQVNDILSDSKGELWVALRNIGIVRGIAPHFEPVEIPNQSYKTGRLLKDHRDRIWVSGDHGLSCLDRNQWRTYTKADGLASDQVYYMVEDKIGRIWLTYHGSYGFTCFDGDKFTTWNTEMGLTNGAIFNIGEDNRNHLWLGSARGVDRFDFARFINYSPLEGYGDYESNSGAFVVDKDDTLWFGTMGGLSHYNPRHDYSRLPTPKPIIDQISLSGHSYAPTEPIRVDHTQNDLEVRLALLTYIPQQRLSMRYRLVGEDDHWKKLEGATVTYNNLRPGNYRIEIQANKYEGPYSEPGMVSFQIKPPLWATWWFRLTCALLGLSTFLLIYRMKLRNIQAKSLQLEKVVATRTDALRVEINEHAKARQALEDAQNQLIDRAHKSGMAEIMSGVLHNIGNVLSSVGTSATVLSEQLERSKLWRLTQVNTLLQQNAENLAQFLAEDPKGQQLLPFLQELEKRLVQEQLTVRENSARLLDKIENIKAYIKTHQSHARAGFFSEDLELAVVVEEALMIQSSALEQIKVEIIRDFNIVPNVRVQKIKLTQILVNLIKNAKEAMAENFGPRRLELSIYHDDEGTFLKVKDNGCGIDSEQLERIFSHGYTTKRKGYGFGLHSCANYMTEMGGRMWATSPGLNQGATFILLFPGEHMVEPTGAVASA